MNEQQSRYYVFSQRTLYIALELIAGYLFGIGSEAYRYYFLLTFVAVAFGLSYYFHRKTT